MSDRENLFELFTEVTSAGQLRPSTFTLEESIGGSFDLRLTAISPVALADSVAAMLFGQRATFVVHGASPLVRRGVIASVSIGGSQDVEHAELHVRVVPRLELMKLRTTSRIFQNLTTVEVLRSLVEGWQLDCETRLSGAYSRRTYITQYRETDWEFFRRIASRDGIGFFLDHPELGPDERQNPGRERVVLFDNAQAYAPIPPGDDLSLGSRLVHDSRKFAPKEHHVTGFRLERRIAPEMIRLGDFDFTKPQLALRASAAVPAAKRSPIHTSLGGEQLSVYLHADRAILDLEGGRGEISDALAAVRLQQAQREGIVGSGVSRCARLAPGLTFTLEEESQAPSLNQAYVVTRVVHEGKVPELDRSSSTEVVYSNRFECAPVEVVVRPPLPALDLRQVTETATVVGPQGTEVFTDDHGRVKVQFHWDVSGDKEGTCWLRVLTTWAGAGWGSQFLPRVGMEVLVGFLSGDVDQPIVLGCVYNGTHPTPFALPAEAAKSGFKSHSVPGGDGGSELTFDDTKGQEHLVLHGERDMTQSTQRNLTIKVGADASIEVAGGHRERVEGSVASSVLGSRAESIAKDLESTIGGSQLVSVTGNREVRVTGTHTTRVEGRELTENHAEVTRVMHADTTERILGHKVTVVGKHDARRSLAEHVEGSVGRHSVGTHHLSSDKEILLTCGESSLRLTPDGLDVVVGKLRFVTDDVSLVATKKVELFAEKQIAFVAENVDVLAKKRAVVAGEKGRLKLTQDATLDGGLVKLNCTPESDSLEPPEYEPPEPTEIELTDEQGAPLAHKRFVLVHGDGSEQAGVLGSDGKASVFVDASCEIVFPEVDGTRRS